jgi:hypothetical protein
MSSKLIAGNATNGSSLSADTTGILEIQTGSTSTTAITVDASQNVGIGTSSPNNPLEVWTKGTGTTAGSNAASRFSSSASGYDCNISFGDNVNASARIGYLSGSQYFWTNSAERMRIDSSGGVGIGLTNPSTGYNAKLAVTGGASRNIECVTSGTTLYGQIGFYNGNGEVGYIGTSGTTTSYVTSSDYRLKENIAPMQNALSVVQQLKPVTYKWKADGSDGQGFIAHELAEIVPDCVTGEKDAVETVNDVDAEGKVIGTKEVPKYQGIDTSFLVATLTAAIQELNAKVDAQAVEIKALKGVA